MSRFRDNESKSQEAFFYNLLQSEGDKKTMNHTNPTNFFSALLVDSLCLIDLEVLAGMPLIEIEKLTMSSLD